MKSYSTRLLATGALVLALNPMLYIAGCSSSTASPASAGKTPVAGVGFQQFADAVHAVMMADRTVYAKHVVTRLKSQEAPCRSQRVLGR